MEFEQLIQLIQTVSDSELTGFKYEENDMKLKMNKEKVRLTSAGAAVQMPASQLTVPAVQAYSAATGAAETSVQEVGQMQESASEEKPGRLIKSPLVGTFYTSSSEEAEPFVTQGASIKKGQTIAIVEAMKLMNDIESEFDGTVAEVLAANGEAVEYGQPLFRIV